MARRELRPGRPVPRDAPGAPRPAVRIVRDQRGRARMRGRPALSHHVRVRPGPAQNARRSAFWFGVLLVGALLLPFVSTSELNALFATAFISAIGAIGLNIVTGYAGQVSLGHAFFLGLGAYTAAVLSGPTDAQRGRVRARHVDLAARRGPRCRRSSGSSSRRSPRGSRACTSRSSRSGSCSSASTSFREMRVHHRRGRHRPLVGAARDFGTRFDRAHRRSAASTITREIEALLPRGSWSCWCWRCSRRTSRGRRSAGPSPPSATVTSPPR